MDKPDLMSATTFKMRTTSIINGVAGRTHIGAIDTALSAYHKKSTDKYRERAMLAGAIVSACEAWLTPRLAAPATAGTNLRIPVVQTLQGQAFDRLKWDTYNFNKSNRGVYKTKALEADYTYERAAYLSTNKTQTPAAANSLKAHMKAMPDEIKTAINHAPGGQPLTTDDLTPAEVIAVSNKLVNEYAYDRVIYKRKRERLSMLINFDANGNGYSDMNVKFDTGGVDWPYAMDAGGGLYAGAPGVLNHSSFLSGKDVICAGSIRAVQGVIQQIDNLSGHYKPKRTELYFAVCALRNANVKINTVKVVIAFEGDHLKRLNNGEKFLQNKSMKEDETSADNGFNWQPAV